MTNTRDALLALKGRIRIEKVDVPGLDAPIYVKGMTGRERDSFESSCFAQQGKTREFTAENLRAKLLARTVCDADGKRLFTDFDVQTIGELPAEVVDVLFSKAQELSGIGSKDMEELKGNSDAAAGDASSTASPSNSDAQSLNS